VAIPEGLEPSAC